MLHLTDAQIDTLVDCNSALPVLDGVFRDMAQGRAAVQPRVRTEAGGVKLSTLGAVLPAAGIVGAKIYTTIAGQFQFMIVLFSALDGRLLATLDANAITRVRTAATTVLAVRALARDGARVLSIFGTGVQGRAHAFALHDLGMFDEIRIVGRGAAPLAAQLCAAQPGCARVATAAQALDGADVVVTTTRAATPIIDGAQLAPGVLVAAIGSSRPDTRELDDMTLRRASSIVVDWREQARHEAGDLLLAAPGVVDWPRVMDLGAALLAPSAVRRSAADLIVYKAVGIGLQDIAVAGLAYQRHQAACQQQP